MPDMKPYSLDLREKILRAYGGVGRRYRTAKLWAKCDDVGSPGPPRPASRVDGGSYDQHIGVSAVCEACARSDPGPSA
jgi:hypothetical protein